MPPWTFGKRSSKSKDPLTAVKRQVTLGASLGKSIASIQGPNSQKDMAASDPKIAELAQEQMINSKSQHYYSTAELYPSPCIYPFAPSLYYTKMTNQSTNWCLVLDIQCHEIYMGYSEQDTLAYHVPVVLESGTFENALIGALSIMVDKFLAENFFRNSLFVIHEDVLPMNQMGYVNVDEFLRRLLHLHPITWIPASLVAAIHNGLVIELSYSHTSVVAVYASAILTYSRNINCERVILPGSDQEVLLDLMDPRSLTTHWHQAERLFSNEVETLETPTLTHMILRCLQCCPITIQVPICKNIVIIGPGCFIRNIELRVHKELRRWLPYPSSLPITCPNRHVGLRELDIHN